ncbi:hypothetical protein A0H81_13220 [Grifola frondosa]|uniref:Tc1-like transposase DDE domain-containing protein n=1 Tax=Grifola frondosa TaxID=5627 RepID=A0A1C7LRF4_GRIFR|nr:hypothetical protein A0H81_13220 [Grifola frondosa]
MKAVLMERVSVWDMLCEKVGGEQKVVGKCKLCRMSQAKKDALRRIELAEMAGQENQLEDSILEQAAAGDADSQDEWCCLYRVVSLQEDFVNEKPMLQHYIESRGHICLFLPKFHCELNPIEMLWGYGKYRYRLAANGKFATARELVPQCLDMADTLTIRRFFRKTWRYMDAYRKGLDARQAAFAVKKYKSHRKTTDNTSNFRLTYTQCFHLVCPTDYNPFYAQCLPTGDFACVYSCAPVGFMLVVPISTHTLRISIGIHSGEGSLQWHHEVVLFMLRLPLHPIPSHLRLRASPAVFLAPRTPYLLCHPIPSYVIINIYLDLPLFSPFLEKVGHCNSIDLHRFTVQVIVDDRVDPGHMASNTDNFHWIPPSSALHPTLDVARYLLGAERATLFNIYVIGAASASSSQTHSLRYNADADGEIERRDNVDMWTECTVLLQSVFLDNSVALYGSHSFTSLRGSLIRAPTQISHHILPVTSSFLSRHHSVYLSLRLWTSGPPMMHR